MTKKVYKKNVYKQIYKQTKWVTKNQYTGGDCLNRGGLYSLQI